MQIWRICCKSLTLRIDPSLYETGGNYSGSRAADGKWLCRSSNKETDCTLFLKCSFGLSKNCRTLEIKLLWTISVFFCRLGKVKLSLCYNWAPPLEGVLGEWIVVPEILDLDTRCERSALRPPCFIPTVKSPGIYWIGGWVGSRAGVDTVSKKIPSPRRDSNPDRPAHYLQISYCNMWYQK
jgi:hypothetical protein